MCEDMKDMKGWEVYAPDWGCADWTLDADRGWELADECTRYRKNRLFPVGMRHLYAIFHNDAAVPIWNSLRFTSQPEDLRLINCARKIKKAFRRASNDPSYNICRRRILTLLYT